MALSCSRAVAGAVVVVAAQALAASASAMPASQGPGAIKAQSPTILRVNGDERWQRRHRGRYDDRDGVVVEAPYTYVESGRRVIVDAPFTNVYVGDRGVHVRAPFVNLYVPR